MKQNRMRVRVVSIFVVWVLMCVAFVGMSGFFVGPEGGLSDWVEDVSIQDDTTRGGSFPTLPQREGYAPEVFGAGTRNAVTAGIILAVAALLIGSYQVGTTTYGQDEHPKARIESFNIVDESGNGIQVGDYFYVEGTVYFYTGGEPKEEGDWHIRVSTSDGKEDEEDGKEDGNTECTIPFSWRFQAAREGAIEITIEAWVNGHYDDSLLYAVDDERVDATPVKLQRTIEKPYAWNPYDPYPSKVFHLEKSRAENEVQSLISGLSGSIYVDDVDVSFNDLGIDEKRVAIKEKRHLIPHILPATFSFWYGLDVNVDLCDGSRWSDQLYEQKEVECTIDPSNLFDAFAKLDRIEWGSIEFEPIQPIEGEEVAFNFDIPDPGEVPVPIDEVTFAWNLGDGGTGDGISVNHTYEDEDLYLVNITALHFGDPIGVEEVYIGVENVAPAITSLDVPIASGVGQLVNFSSDYNDPGLSDTVQATWYFGDGTNDTGFNVSHTFDSYGNFSYTLVIEDGDDGFDLMFGSLWVQGQRPTASAGGPYTVNETFPLTIDGSDSTDTDGQVTMWLWDFGDGTQGYANMTNHTYMHDGTYTIKLTVVDDNGLEDVDATTVTVKDVPPTIVEIDVIYNDAFNITIVGSATIPEPGITLNYAWDFGDGTLITGETKVTHLYQSANTYVINLTVDDGEGHEATATKTITISAPPPSTTEIQDTLESMQAEIGEIQDILYIFVVITCALIVLLIMVACLTFFLWKRIKTAPPPKAESPEELYEEEEEFEEKPEEEFEEDNEE